jgi:hypothetical protein
VVCGGETGRPAAVAGVVRENFSSMLDTDAFALELTLAVPSLSPLIPSSQLSPSLEVEARVRPFFFQEPPFFSLGVSFFFLVVLC